MTGYELGASNPPQIRRDPNKHFYSAFVKITDPSKFNEVADKMRTFDIEGKSCRALPFDRSFLGANRSALKDYSIFIKFDRDVKEGQV